MTYQELDSAAIDAHRAGNMWPKFWPSVAGEVAVAEQHDPAAFHQIVRLHLLKSGDNAGMEPVGNGEQAVAVPILGTGGASTVSVIDWTVAGVVPARI